MNYFGKVDLGSSVVGQIAVHPLLIKKVNLLYSQYSARWSNIYIHTHTTRCKLISLFHLTFDIIDPPPSAFFSLNFCRVKASPDNGINEHLLLCFMDVVIWGHEHECLVDPQVTRNVS